MQLLMQFTVISALLICVFVAFYIAKVNRGYDAREQQKRAKSSGQASVPGDPMPPA